MDPRRTGFAEQTAQDERACEPVITIVFTSVTETLAALRRSANLARHLDSRIRILVPGVVPYPLPLQEPAVNHEFRLRHFRTWCEECAIGTDIEVRLCRDPVTCILESLHPHSVVVVGGSRNWRPWSWKRRLCKRLRRAGHEVLSVSDQTAGAPQSPGSEVPVV